MITTIAFDGDDTLWHNMPVFRLTEEWFQELLAPYGSDRVPIDLLTEREMHNLGIFGYGIKGFTLSMIETAIEVTAGKVTADDIQAIIDSGKRMLNHPVEVLDGVRAALQSLQPRFRLMVITKGDLFDQQSKIARSGLGELFWRTEIVSEKDPAAYERILAAHDIGPHEFMMVGNSLKSDILPVLEVGAYAVHIPYHITWVHEQVERDVEPNERLRQLERISDLPHLLDTLCAEPTM